MLEEHHALACRSARSAFIGWELDDHDSMVPAGASRMTWSPQPAPVLPSQASRFRPQRTVDSARAAPPAESDIGMRRAPRFPTRLRCRDMARRARCRRWPSRASDACRAAGGGGRHPLVVYASGDGRYLSATSAELATSPQLWDRLPRPATPTISRPGGTCSAADDGGGSRLHLSAASSAASIMWCDS